MKKISLLLLSIFLLGLGNVGAQTTTPVISTDDSGPWYYILVRGNLQVTDPRSNRVLTGCENTGYQDSLSLLRPFNQLSVAGTFAQDSIDSATGLERQMWRVEKAADGQYKLINKFYKKAIGTYYWDNTDHWKNNIDPDTGEMLETISGEKDKVLPVLMDDPNTTWGLINHPSYPGYVRLKANTEIQMPENTNKFIYMHQGNARWKYRQIMEHEGWAGDNSAYQFVEPENLHIKVLPESIDLGVLFEGEEATEIKDTVLITVYQNLTSNLDLFSNSDPEDMFYGTGINVGSNVWDDKKGGFAEIYYYDQSGYGEGKYDGKLYIEANIGDRKVSVPLGVKFEIIGKTPVKPSTDTETNWYYVVYDKRKGLFLTDTGADQPLEGLDLEEGNDGQLWKFIESDVEDEFIIVSKTGNYIDFGTVTSVAADGTETEVERFISVAEDKENTFSFDFRGKADRGWQIKWNQYTYIDEDTQEEVTSFTYLNKTNTDDQICAYSYMPDAGSAVAFFAEGKLDLGKPAFSVENKEVWYYLQFNRQPNKVIVETTDALAEDAAPNITQAAKIDGDYTQQWKLEGDETEFAIINRESGNAFKLATTSLGKRIVAADEAHMFQLDKGTEFKLWSLKNADEYDGEENKIYLNDFGGSGTYIGQWSLDAGGNINFIPADPSSIDDIVVDTEDSVNDPIIATSYYTIEGISVGATAPKAQGIYIRKALHKSGKVTATKILVTK